MSAPTAAPASTPASTAIAPGHTGLSVTALDRSIAFYREILGLELIQRGDEEGRRFAFLGAGGRLFLTLWQQSTEAFATRSAGLHHLAFQVADIGDVEAVEARLRARGLTPHYDAVVPHGEGAESAALYFTDPDGIRLEVYSPTGGAGRATPVAGAPSCGFF